MRKRGGGEKERGGREGKGREGKGRRKEEGKIEEREKQYINTIKYNYGCDHTH